MDTQQAKKLVDAIADYKFMFFDYAAVHGRHKPHHNSPEEQWEAAKALYNKQVEIARLLDAAAITEERNLGGIPVPRFHDFPNSKGLNFMHEQAYHIWYQCRQDEVTGRNNSTSRVMPQYYISLMLDPAAVREAVKGS